MPANPVIFIDTSVLLNLLRVPGFSGDAEKCQLQFREWQEGGAKFVLPITALIETGNFIQQCQGDRRAAATRFASAIEAAKGSQPPWAIRDVSWDSDFLDALLAGDSTGSDLVSHFSARGLGAGDLAILVERDQFRSSTAFDDVRIWSLDAILQSQA